MKGIDGGYKLSELLLGRGGSADAIVNVAAVELRFWAVVLAKKLVFDKTYKYLLIRKLLKWLDSFSKSFRLHYLYIETNEWNV